MLYQVTRNPVRLTTVPQKGREKGAGKKISSDISVFFLHRLVCIDYDGNGIEK